MIRVYLPDGRLILARPAAAKALKQLRPEVSIVSGDTPTE